MPDQHIDLSRLDHLFKGDQSQVREWITLYLQEAPQYFTQLSVSLENGDVQGLAAAAHDLQPQAHYLGSAHMVELLAAIEAHSMNGASLPCGDLLNQLLPLHEAIDAELRALLKAE